MSIEMVRIPSETPNISNIDDFVGLRYAFGNQDGYILDKGNECSYTINGAIFKINSGRLVLQGIECDIDANGVEITVDNVSTKRYYSVYLQVNLALNETKILSTYDTATYPTIAVGDNLTKNTTGTARLVIYNFEAINGVISNVQKNIKQIQYLKDFKPQESFNSDNSKKINDLELKRDDVGVLKINDIVIEQKQILFEGEASNFESSTNMKKLNGTIKPGDVIEITGLISGSEIIVQRIKYTPGLNDAGTEGSQNFWFSHVRVVSALSVEFYGAELRLSHTQSDSYIRISGGTYSKIGQSTDYGSRTTTIYKVAKIIE